MYDERGWCVPGTSRCFSEDQEQFAFFGSFLFPFSVDQSATTLLWLAPTPLPQHLQHYSVALLSSSLFFFFCSPPPLPLSFDPSTFARPSSVGRPLFVCLSFSSTTFLYPPSSPKTNQPASLRPVYSRSPGLESVTFDRIDFSPLGLASCSSKYRHYSPCPSFSAVPSLVRSIGPVRPTLPAQGKHHHSTNGSSLIVADNFPSVGYLTVNQKLYVVG